jgi:Tryptophan dimethylallyltransferase
MGGAAEMLHDHIGTQLRMLCDAIGLSPAAPLAGLRDLLGPAGERPLREPPLWPTDISDDHSPVEFSVACEANQAPTLRILGERMGALPDRRTNLRAALELVRTLTGRLGLSLDHFDSVRPVFLDRDPLADFALWFSMVYRPESPAELKVYLNPGTHGAARAPQLVSDALTRLGLAGAYATTLRYGVRPGELNRLDRFAFFALDLHDQPHSRVKLYLSHFDSDVAQLVRAASAVPGVDTGLVRDFLGAARCAGPLTRRPAVSGYTFVRGDTDRPSTYSLYLPIRDYVEDDEQARERVFAVLNRFGLDTAVIDRAIAAVARRPLDEGPGLIAHVSLRLAAHRPPGVTVYLSSEAYSHQRVPAHSGSET